MTISPERLKLDAAEFKSIYGESGKITWVAAPGRVNLIGEHTDYHEGFVLPAAIDRHVRILGRPRNDRIVRIFSATFKGSYKFSFDSPMSDVKGWARRAEGIIRTVLEDVTDKHGIDIWMDADLSVGGGLSSSAASMAVLGTLAASLHGRKLENIAFAKTLQAAEHSFAGLKCGIMDQLAILLGKANCALLLDCRSLETRHVKLPSEWALVIMDTNVKHDLASSEYNKRQIECGAVLNAMRKRRAEIRSLRDVSFAELEAVRGECDPVGIKRCLHVLAENERVHKTVKALESADAGTIGELFAASHNSLRDDYSVSCRELDAMVEAAADAPGCIGSRMTGGGFGGSTVNLVHKDKAQAFAEHVSTKYLKATGVEGKAIIAVTSDGVVAGEL